MLENCEDAFGICCWAGYPSLFIAITCNSRWPEIMRFVKKRGLKPKDRPDILCRVFRVKLDQVPRDLRKGCIFGRVIGYVCMIEFQKQGLPHTHILLFMHLEDKPSTASDIDRMISAAIPDEKEDPTLFVAVETYLLLKYQAHINVEYTCQTSAIKYLFKYIHKGKDQLTTAFSHLAPDGDKSRSTDEIQKYYDCRYPHVQRLSFHLPQEKTIIFKDGDSIEDVLKKVNAKKLMFEAWMRANKKYEEARNLTYSKFPTKFVYKEDKQEWTRRKKGFAIGRINHVPFGTGEDFYLRMLINFQKGCTQYEDIRTINGVEYPSFKDTCYCFVLLDDDKEYIDGIKEARF
ncbi:hypothetical protein Q3G72_026753 [Acer saccharum]|nr:hypothetical protein Q3G72_026753 [Acer saccharum]